MAQWEMCCVGFVSWRMIYPEQKWDNKIVLYYYTPTGVITKFPSINSWGQTIAVLGAAEWEAITMQHGLSINAPHVGWSGSLRGGSVAHPSGEKDFRFEGGNRVEIDKWIYDSCHMVAYFKRPIQAGRNIDDAL